MCQFFLKMVPWIDGSGKEARTAHHNFSRVSGRPLRQHLTPLQWWVIWLAPHSPVSKFNNSSANMACFVDWLSLSPPLLSVSSSKLLISTKSTNALFFLRTAGSGLAASVESRQSNQIINMKCLAFLLVRLCSIYYTRLLLDNFSNIDAVESLSEIDTDCSGLHNPLAHMTQKVQ